MWYLTDQMSQDAENLLDCGQEDAFENNPVAQNTSDEMYIYLLQKPTV